MRGSYNGLERPLYAVLIGSLFAILGAPADAQSVNLSGLSDVSLGSLRPQVDAKSSQSVCAYSDIAGKGYMVTAQGSGAGGDFVLTATGAADLPYSVEWSDQPGRTSGHNLSPGMPLGNLSSSATDPSCASGPVLTASLIVTLASNDLYAARAGISYAGTLALTIAPQ